jgi:hypothetical protein
MLVVDGFFENGTFTPRNSDVNVTGRLEATLTIKENNEAHEQTERIKKWGEIREMLLESGDEVLEGEPKKIHLRSLEN